MIHRDEIDGLRAIAVGIVVFCHAGLPFFSGGFVGVDVFFVISGFLITSQLKQHRHRRIGALLIDFYARRARRILPSLALVIFVTIAAASVLMLPGEQQELGASSISAALFASNIYFWVAANSYFAPSSDLQPLLHTWSLGVEEQFYIVWPVILLTLWAVERFWRVANGRMTMAVVFALTAASFVLSIAFVSHNPGATFFLTPFRLWELGAGALLAIYLDDAKPRLSPSFGMAGLAAILIATITYSPETTFPGVAAALPVLGAVLIIAARPTGMAGWLLTLRPMKLTGTISYAWYLWHWPFLALARMVNVGERDLARDLLIVCLAYVPAYLSTRYLETPIRKRELSWFVTDNRSVVSGVLVILFACAAALGIIVQGSNAYLATIPASRDCMFARTSDQARHSEPCVLSRGEGGSIFLVGESQANHWSPVLGDWARKNDQYAIDLSFSACNVLAAAYAVDPSKYTPICRDYARNIPRELEAAAASGKPVGLVVSASWTHPTNMNEPTRERDLHAALTAMEGLGVRILILGVTPTFEFSAPSCIARRESNICRTARSKHDADRLQIDRMFTSAFATRDGIKYWDPTSAFCDSSWSYPNGQTGVLFVDKNHLTPAGAMVAQPQLGPLFSWLANIRNRPQAKNLPPARAAGDA